MKDDFISRAAALDFVSAMNFCGEISDEAYQKLTVHFENLPSAQSDKWEDTVYRKAVERLLAYFVPEERYAEAVDGLRRLPSAQPGWIPCTTETMPKNKSNVLTVIYIPGRQAHIRSGWYEDGLFMNDNGDTWKATDKEVVGWMYQPKLPKPWEGEKP